MLINKVFLLYAKTSNGKENKSVMTDSDRESVHSNWSELIYVNEEAEYSKLRGGMNVNACTSNASLEEAAKATLTQSRKRAVKNIVLVPYKLKSMEWGSWRTKSHTQLALLLALL